MRIDELDEFQGVTPQLVTDWLLAKGWTQKPTQPRWWIKGEDGFLFDEKTFDQVWFWAYALAAIYTKGNLQSLLCEINPRMRKGMPSQSALAASSHWLVLDNETQEIALYRSNGRRLHVARAPFELMPDFGDFVSYWPCDEHGNKVRWPTDANGVML